MFSWYARQFHPLTMLQYQWANLRRRVMKPDESLTGYKIILYTNIRGRDRIVRHPWKLEKSLLATKKSWQAYGRSSWSCLPRRDYDGTHKPWRILDERGKTIDMERKVGRRPRVMKDARESVSWTDIYRVEPLPRITPSEGDWYYRGHHFNANHQAPKQGMVERD